MAELNKGTLTAENNNSFPNNNTGFITPTLLRTFNGNMIDSLVDEVSYNIDSASFSSSISQLKNFSSSLDNTYATDAQLSASASTLQDNINLKVNTSSTSSMTVLSSSYAVTASFALNVPITASYAISSSQATSASYAVTASHATNIPVTASYAISASNAQTASYLLGVIESASFAQTASFLLGSIASASYALFAETSSFALTSSITQQVSTSISTQNLQHNVLFVDTTGPGLVQVDGGLRYNPNTNLLTTTASLALTASFAENVPSNFATTGSNTFIGNEIISGNLVVTGSNINLEVDAPALSVGTTNVKTIADSSASGVITSLDITRFGAGPTGDLTAIRLQTFSGSSDTSGDRLLSRITTGVNRHTTLGLSGSVVNNQINAVWATGSSAFTAQIVETAQSNSAVLSLNVGNLASNNAGGTASISAGLIRIGGNASHTISSTGSFGAMVLVAPLNTPALSIRSGSFELTTPQGSGSFYSNCPITSSGLRINGDALVNDLIISGVFSGNSTLQVKGNTSLSGSIRLSGSGDYLITSNNSLYTGLSGSLINNLGSVYTASSAVSHIVNVGSASYAFLLQNGLTDPNTLYFVDGNSAFATTGSNTFIGNQTIIGNTTITGSLTLSSSAAIELNVIGNTLLTGSVQGNVSTLSISANTASLNLDLGNFFTLQLVSGSTTFLNPSNIKPGQTINIRVNTTGSGLLTFPSSVKQISGSSYIPTTTTGVDVITLISFDTTELYLANVKNLI